MQPCRWYQIEQIYKQLKEATKIEKKQDGIDSPEDKSQNFDSSQDTGQLSSKSLWEDLVSRYMKDICLKVSENLKVSKRMKK